VQRAHFDDVLIREAEKQGAEVRFRHVVEAVDVTGAQPVVTVRDPDGQAYNVQAKCLLDASGFGRILPRLLKLESPSNFPVRAAIFTHVEDRVAPGTFDRNKIRIGVHPEHVDVWYWTIPFSNGRCSQGVVAEKSFLDQYPGDEMAKLKQLVSEEPGLAHLLRDANWDTPARQIVGYSANVSSLWGNGYALLGNAGEFLDPVFSSGVTIAFKSASLATACLARQLAGETVDWEADYAKPLKAGVDCFRTFVEAWYEGRFQTLIFHPNATPEIRRMISSILAGYAWDRSNPFVAESRRRLNVLEQLCAV
jgi:flavin-dependent dehydrogenase